MNNSCIICGTGINAHSIITSLREIGFKNNIHILRPESDNAGFAELLNPKIPVFEFSGKPGIDLINKIDSLGLFGTKFIFFTDERFHQELSHLRAKKEIPQDIVFHLGSEKIDTILDRYLFMDFLAENKTDEIPETIPGEEDPFSIFGDKFVFRPRRSWNSNNIRQKVLIISNRKQFERELKQAGENGVELKDLCFQELLSTDSRHNISVCGWYSEDYKHLYCTRKVLQHPPASGDGDVVEIIKDPENLIHTAVDILSKFDYHGPFELEFVYDKNDKKYKIIELNPRFWLQHGLIEAISENVIVARYLGIEPDQNQNYKQDLKYWIHTPYSIYRLLKLDFRIIRYLFSKHTHKPMTILEAVNSQIISFFRFIIRKKVQ